VSKVEGLLRYKFLMAFFLYKKSNFCKKTKKILINSKSYFRFGQWSEGLVIYRGEDVIGKRSAVSVIPWWDL